ncbi:pirin family protein [Eikenella sp. S3360]|uniref:Pirin family protein n=1 Tax=Eikenella glucosivorans TaxID=2766967 RepID=A0ABS0NBB5_9NEIS|nr:pirin family protein [Eikenella glucosivorans]MBH5329609.1 pirin family protein [Eikenella glucosivorans]
MTLHKLSAKTHDVGGIPVARLLPQRSHRTVGAWCFLDHAGPARFSADESGMQVGAHPHTNLQTFTWMLEGEILHRDSLGSRQLIRPKQVNLMTAGTGDESGISHTEQTPKGIKALHAVQLWIALPMHKAIAPAFQHYPELPEWADGGTDYILINGSLAGRTAPTEQHSPLLGADIRFREHATLCLPAQAGWEYGVLVLKGSVEIGGQTFLPDELAKFERADIQQTLSIRAAAGSHIILLGGEPLPHPTRMWWNFVADSQAALEKAVADWNSGHSRFGKIDLAGTKLKRLAAPELKNTIR